MNPWIFLAIGVVFEIMGTTSLKLSDGFSNLWPSVATIAFFCTSLVMISISVKTLDIGLVYAIWSGAGISLITLIGVIYFQETLTLSRAFFVSMIILGICGLYLSDQHFSSGKGEATDAEPASYE